MKREGWKRFKCKIFGHNFDTTTTEIHGGQVKCSDICSRCGKEETAYGLLYDPFLFNLSKRGPVK